MIPTYNEWESIKKTIDGINANVQVQILIIDDNSPDKTADFVDSLLYKNVDILRRAKKEGLGNAYKSAITKYLDSGYCHFISMDADGSHRPEDLKAMIQTLADYPKAHLIMGSRWMPGGSIVNWPKYRIWLSKVGTRYAKWALKMPQSDLTGGFRIYSVEALHKIDLAQITSNGYCYQIEMAFAISHLTNKSPDRTLNNDSIVEVPITFIEREAGVSKMNQRIVFEAMAKVSKLGFTLRLNPTADKLHYVK